MKESSFFNRTSLTPPQIFDPHLLENTNLSPSSFFQLVFISKSYFESEGLKLIQTNEIEEKKTTFAELAMSQR